MKFSLFDLVVAMCVSASLTAVIYDSVLSKSVALVNNQRKVMEQQRNTLNRCVSAFANTVNNSIVVHIVDDVNDGKQ